MFILLSENNRHKKYKENRDNKEKLSSTIKCHTHNSFMGSIAAHNV